MPTLLFVQVENYQKRENEEQQQFVIVVKIKF